MQILIYIPTKDRELSESIAEKVADLLVGYGLGIDDGAVMSVVEDGEPVLVTGGEPITIDVSTFEDNPREIDISTMGERRPPPESEPRGHGHGKE